MMIQYDVNNRHSLLSELPGENILLLDGAMGTIIQSCKPEEDDFRGKRFQEHYCDIQLYASE